jgi:flagellin
MSLVINSNTTATVTRNYLNANQANLKTSLSRLASGSKIVNPSDDAGGLAVGNKLAATLNRNTRTQQNVQNAISFLQVQDGALSATGKILDRMSELKTMSLDVTKNALDIANYDAEFTQLQAQLSNIRSQKFNGIALFGTDNAKTAASTAEDLTVYTTELADTQVGLTRLSIFTDATYDSTDTTGTKNGLIADTLADGATAGATGATGDLLFATDTLSIYSVDNFTTFIQNAATARANNGAEMSRMESSLAMLTANHANIEAARSRLMDVDIAIESTHFAKHNILVQSSAAMLSQANGIPNIALQLLG